MPDDHVEATRTHVWSLSKSRFEETGFFILKIYKLFLSLITSHIDFYRYLY